MERTTKGLWLEIIRVRSSRDVEEMIREIIRALKSDPDVPSAKEVRLFSNAVGDLAIHLSWKSDRTPGDGSSLGLRLAAALSEYGLINHTMWTEEV